MRESANGRCYVKKVVFLPRLHVLDIGWPVFFPDYFILRKKFILQGIQLLLCHKNWYSLQDTQLFGRAPQDTMQL